MSRPTPAHAALVTRFRLPDGAGQLTYDSTVSGPSQCSTSRPAGIAYRALVMTAGLRGRPGVGRAWQRAWQAGCARWTGPVRIRLHGRPVVVNFGYPYPVFARQYPTYNAPLVDAVRAAARDRGRAVTVVDVGAAVGDTVLLLEERCAAAVAQFLCIDGDEEFLGYLRQNLGTDPAVEIHAAMLSRGEQTTPALVRTHRGTASAIGTDRIAATTLDHEIAGSRLADTGTDVLKVDVDGYDGAVLAGATQTLGRCHPVVVFEWHPVLYDRAGNDVVEPFDLLGGLGYRHFEWFDRTGVAAGVMAGVDHDELGRRAALAREIPEHDLHWDVVATVADAAGAP